MEVVLLWLIAVWLELAEDDLWIYVSFKHFAVNEFLDVRIFLEEKVITFSHSLFHVRVMSFVASFLLYQPILWIMWGLLLPALLFRCNFRHFLHLFKLKFSLNFITFIEFNLVSDRFHPRKLGIRRDETFKIYIVLTHLGVGKGWLSVIHSIRIPYSIFARIS